MLMINPFMAPPNKKKPLTCGREKWATSYDNMIGCLTLAISGRGQSGGACRTPRVGRTRYASAERPG